MNLDVVIVGGVFYDGRGGVLDVPALGIRGDRLVLIRDPGLALGRKTIDATGLAVCPGFIDIHSHSDFVGLRFPNAPNRALAGVTTEVVGNCDFGAFPLTEAGEDRVRHEYAGLDLAIDWRGVHEYFDRQRSTPTVVNRAVLIGHGTVRAAVMGYDARPADGGEIDRMRRIVEEAMSAGAFGLSTGLIYTPGCFAEPREIAELAGVVSRFGGFYASHIRSEGDAVLEAVDEFLDVLRRSGVRGQLSHVKVMGPHNWRKFEALRERLFSARDREGLTLMADRYPYDASNNALTSALLPAWVRAMEPARMLAMLADPAERAKLRREAWDERSDATLAERIMVIAIRTPAMLPYQGLRLSEIGRRMGLHPFDAACEIIVAESGRCEAVSFSMEPAQTREILSWPFVMIGSDSSARGGAGSECHDHPHPRTFGTPARFLGEYVREQRLIDWPAAIHRLCGMPASVLGLNDRGVLADGAVADVVIFDPGAISDRATYERPAVTPFGIQHVFVNGQVVVNAGRQTDSRPGRLLSFSD